MHSFKDTEGREWSITVTLGTLKRLRERFKLDFLQDDKSLTLAVGQLQMDPELLSSVLFFLVEKQAGERSVTQADFDDALAGDVIADATKAFIEDLVDCFPPLRRRPLAEAVGAMEAAMVRAGEKAIEVMHSPQVMSHVDRAVEEAGKSYLSSLESSASPGETLKS